MSSNSIVSGLAAAIAGALAIVAAPAHAAGGVTLENRLQACVAIQPDMRTVEHGVALQGVTLDVRKPIGECGCKSAIMSYASQVVLAGGARSPLQQGQLNAAGSGPRTVVLASDTTLVADRPLTLTFECAPAR
ncbi:MAG TPA: DUF2195 family protein [Bordetella sp.]|nr:DUF2195 family protein [Bordetella sp.]